MPQVPSTQETITEESQQQLGVQKSMESDLLNKIKDGDVFKSIDFKDLPGRQQEEEPQEEQSKEPQDSQEEQSQEETQEQEDDQEEVVPKSKIQPRIDKLTSQIKQLEQRLAEKEASNDQPLDDTQRKLEAMSENELEDVLTNVRVAKEKARDDDEKLLELVKLERQIEKTIVSAPQKFVQRQVTEFNKMAAKIASSEDIPETAHTKILEIAKGIYQNYPKMQKSVDGQAMALELAADHYRDLVKANAHKPNVQNLKGQINNLKKKTSLDTKVLKTGNDKINLDNLRNNAMHGNMRDKEKFMHNDPRFKIDAMIPDHLKGK